MKNTVNSLQVISTLIDKLDASKLDVKSIKKLVKLSSEIKSHVEDHTESFKMIMESYKLSSEEGSYDWSEHEYKAEISDKVKELTSSEIVLSSDLNFIDEDAFYDACKDLVISQIAFLGETLSE